MPKQPFRKEAKFSGVSEREIARQRDVIARGRALVRSGGRYVTDGAADDCERDGGAMRGPFGGVVQFFMKDVAGQIGAGILLACAATVGYGYLTKDELTLERPTAVEPLAAASQLSVLERSEARAVVLERIPGEVSAEWSNETRHVVSGHVVVCGEVRWTSARGQNSGLRRFVAFRNSASIEGQRYFDDDWRLNCR